MIPRIGETRLSIIMDNLTRRQNWRYGTAVVTVAIAAILAHLVEPSDGKYHHVLMYFTAILLSSVLAGFGPGLLATALTMSAILLTPADHLNSHEAQLVIIQGILVSIVGGILRAAKLNSLSRLNANLKLEQQILEVGDDERRRIGLDLHDGLGQHLSGISLLGETLAHQLKNGQKPEPATIENITRLVGESVRITRDLAKTISPVTLERDGLIAAIKELAESSSKVLGVQCMSEFDIQELQLEPPRSRHIFRIAQEAVNNSVRHGKAKMVRIRLQRQNDELRLTVTDDGSGLSQKTAINPGLGLRIMQYRAKMLGAMLTVQRAGTESGTVVTCVCSINDRA